LIDIAAKDGCVGRRPAVVVEIERLRRQCWTGKQIAAETGVSKLSALEPVEPARRCGYDRRPMVTF
jgi:hypothetical protein